MTERTYGVIKRTLEGCLQPAMKGSERYDLAAHIRELQDDVKVARGQYQGALDLIKQLEAENAKLKAERRNLAMRVARSSFNQGIDYGYDVDDGNSRGIHVGTLIENIVSQELAE